MVIPQEVTIYSKDWKLKGTAIVAKKENETVYFAAAPPFTVVRGDLFVEGNTLDVFVHDPKLVEFKGLARH